MSEPENGRRQDSGTRTRVDELFDWFRWHITRQWVAIGIAYLVLIVTALGTGYLIGQQQDDRREAITDVCRANNEQARGIHKVIARAAPRLLPSVERDIPVEPNCDAYADRFTR